MLAHRNPRAAEAPHMEDGFGDRWSLVKSFRSLCCRGRTHRNWCALIFEAALLGVEFLTFGVKFTAPMKDREGPKLLCLVGIE